MKRLTLILMALTLSAVVHAQYAMTPYNELELLSTKGSRVYLGVEKLDKQQAAQCFSDVAGVDRSADYLKYRKGYKTGLGLTIGGASLMAVGGTVLLGSTLSVVILALPAALSGDPDFLNGVEVAANIGGYTALAGLAMTIAGVPTLCIYSNRISTLAEEYNYDKVLKSRTQTQLTFGFQRNGVGLTLMF